MHASETVLDRLTRLHPKLIDLSLGRMERLLAALDHPERRLPPVIHVAGTNGKGSTCAYLRAAGEAAGLRVHVYTSPHLVTFHERIRLAGRLIEEAHLYALLLECERANGEAPITFFEITTAAAMLAFARVPADLLVLEVGLGGRLDATNVIARPAASAITSISIDHVEFLGDTLAAIAAEKAGIIKRGAPAITGAQDPVALGVIEAAAVRQGAPLLRRGREWDIAPRADGTGLVFRDADGEVALPFPALPGLWQHDNAGIAIAALRAAARAGRGPRIGDAALGLGLARAEWPARMQRLKRGPLAQSLPAGDELWLDGGHNEGAGQVLKEFLGRWRADAPARPIELIVGMKGTKQVDAFLAPLAPHVSRLVAVPIPRDPKAQPPERIAEAARAAGITEATHAADVAAARARLIATRAPGAAPARVLICGSLYLAGAILAGNG
ncbi:MAG: bifunctional folylpolyglutamate synthase/dihydrofolate synthase [Alphaproteobacteria bacterium]|nr:bifunctional folylpolyglutamate synthase/dihydrofolate synthase [Alphaproteobacteria bacterium]